MMSFPCADSSGRRNWPAAPVIGCELTLYNPGYPPGTFFYDRLRRLARPGPGS